MKNEYYYLIRISYLGFRYSGWQKQPGTKTVEGMVLKTLKFILPDRKFKILASGRTDAKVSSLDGAFELFMKDGPLGDLTQFMEEFNKNLPTDIKAININEVNEKFNIIKDATIKEYTYFFSCGSKCHPFCAPFMVSFPEVLNIELMKEGATLFKGTHDFSVYTSRDTKSSNLVRTIEDCFIEENTLLKANFFPEKTYVLRIRGKGFLRYQVRMVMGALIQLGMGELNLEDIHRSLKPSSKMQISRVAPGSGLMLHSLDFHLAG